MKRLEQAMLERTQQLPRLYTKRLIQKKLEEAGAPDPENGAEQMTAHLLRQTGKRFRWPNGSPNKGITIDLNAEDAELVREQVQTFLDEGLPEVMRNTADRMARMIVKDVRKRWETQRAEILEYEAFYRLSIDARWSQAIEALRVLKMSVMELADAFLRREYRRKSLKNRARNGVIIRLHARACQVTGEIITLLEAGYPDGAFARWRTLHEITVVAFLIEEHGDELAERYLAHEAIEHEKAARAFGKVHKNLKARALAKKERAEIREAYDAAIAKYGPEFDGQYGWASVLRGGKRCTFENLEELAGRSGLRLHYKYASDVVHAGQRGIRYPLGTQGEPEEILGGPSHFGLEEAGIQAAFTLTAMSSLLISSRTGIKQMVELRTFSLLRDRAARAFARTARQLELEIAEEWNECEASPS